MNRFVSLYEDLDRSTSNRDKEDAIIQYFSSVKPREASWAIFVISGGKVNSGQSRFVKTGELRVWVSELTGFPLWVVEDSYRQVGDLAETLALLINAFKKTHSIVDNQFEKSLCEYKKYDFSVIGHGDLTTWIEDFLLEMPNTCENFRKKYVQEIWLQLDLQSCLVFNKLMTGSLRIGISKKMLLNALARMTGIRQDEMAHRFVGDWVPSSEAYEALIDPSSTQFASLKPFPFYLASPLTEGIESLGEPEKWIAEWKWDGIRTQLINRKPDAAYLWSRGEERLDGRFPEIENLIQNASDEFVIDGELVAWDAELDVPKPFINLQKRIQKRKPTAKLIKEVPCRIIAYDLLELNRQDVRKFSLLERRSELEKIINKLNSPNLIISQSLDFSSWNELEVARERSKEVKAEGVMLKMWHSPYLEGRKRGAWWKWKVDPLTIDAVLIYAQSGSGRRSTLHTDYTFALWDSTGRLVPVAKAYSGLTDKELVYFDNWIKKNTIEKFGPVRAVNPMLVFEIAFEAVNLSKRHKSGVAVRFPRIVRYRDDKKPEDANSVQELIELCSD